MTLADLRCRSLAGWTWHGRCVLV